MAKEIRARFLHGVLEPLEALDLKASGDRLSACLTQIFDAVIFAIL